MSNKHASKQHGLVGNKRPKSKLRKRRNKAKARARKEARIAEKTKSNPSKKTTNKAEKDPKAPQTKSKE